MCEYVINAVKQYKIIAIMRKVSHADIIPVAEALYAGGIRLIEVTFNQASATGKQSTAKSIKALCDHFGDKMFIGAGTVMNVHQVETAVCAGAKFIVSPNTNLQVIKRTIELGAVSIPGALTPSEIALAYEAGAEFVKLFPAGEFGISYIKSIRAPLNHIPILAVGGIDDNNMKDFFEAGVSGVGIGSNIVKNTLISMRKFDELTVLAKKYTEQILGFHKTKDKKFLPSTPI
jgi:2-dehydro-3-deoxyphosphogluconate aldolase/(4S)-4-hydroxy-2-oxoglutarate aldolase